MLHSIRGRLLLITGLMVFATATVVVFVAGRSATVAFEHAVERRLEAQEENIASVLRNYYLEHGSWQGVEALLAQIERLAGSRVVLSSSGGLILGDSQGTLVGSSADLPWPREAVPIVVSGEVVGLVHVGPGLRTTLERLQFPFLISPALPLGALGAATVAILLTVALSHRILGPVDELTKAAQRMAAGEMNQRVSVVSLDEVGELARAFNAMADGLAEQENMRRNMVSDIAHELRTPLTNILGYLEAAQDGLVPLDEDLVSTLYEEATLLSRLVRDLQELALADAGQLSLHRAPVNVSEIVADALTMMLPQAQAKGVQLESAVSESLPPVYADADRVAQVLRNLVNNAVSATDSGGRVSLEAEERDGYVLVTVRDNGHGIPPEALAHVFDRFYRVDRARSRSTGGHGLGLAIVKQWVNAHGGQVWAESTIGVGSAFHFTLPIADESTDPSGVQEYNGAIRQCLKRLPPER